MAKLPQKSDDLRPLRQMGLFDRNATQSSSVTTISFLTRVSRYGWDVLGVFLLAGGLIVTLGLLGITQGTIVDKLVFRLTQWFGLGRYLLAGSLLLIGAIVLRWRKYPPEKINLGQIIAIELAVFTLMGILSSIFDKSLAIVEDGKGLGGIVGWGIAELFGLIFGGVGRIIVLIFLLILLVGAGFKLFTRLEKWVNQELGNEDELVVDKVPAIVQPSLAKESQAESPVTERATKKEPIKPALPPEFRKTLPAAKTEDESPVMKPGRHHVLPPLDLLEMEKSYSPDHATINMTAGLIEKTLADFAIPARVVGYRVGPTVTQYAVEPGFVERNGSDDRHKIRISQISALSKDLALALKAERLRIEAPVPGKSYVGVEVPNNKNVIVRLRPILESETFFRLNSPLAVPLGRDVSGKAVVSDLATMPHLLIAGTTNSGKSVCIAALITCLAMNNTPEDLKLVLIDPKMVELTRFNGLPHILGQVETDIERIMGVLRWATAEMDYRYKLLEKMHARNLDSYNAKMERSGQSKLPRIVVMIDELADLMMSAPDQTEYALVRLAQKSRAVGIHLVVATQRPSTDVVTGVIKANFPTRIAFTVASSVDSRVILDTNGAETLLGKGDMLFLHPEAGLPVRSQGVMVADKELEQVIKWWKAAVAEQPAEEIIDAVPWEETINNQSDGNGDDDLVDQAIELLRKERRASASYLQRQLRIGYPRAARLIEQLEEMGVIGPAQSGGKERDILLENGESDD
jgi:S-DNA-T family DNA segregation ATPase FtsK/SpoIIIE